MLKNATYNLMETATVISKGLHRYDTLKKDAKGCQQLWDHLEKVDEQTLARITPHLRQHLDRDEGATRAAA